MLPVVPEVVLPAEGLAADVAGVGTLVGVRPLVDQEVIGLGELPVAELADELLLGPGLGLAGGGLHHPLLRPAHAQPLQCEVGLEGLEAEGRRLGAVRGQQGRLLERAHHRRLQAQHYPTKLALHPSADWGRRRPPPPSPPRLLRQLTIH